MFSIEVKELTKKFNGFVAVDKISFKVKEGEIFGLLGPNGAGKTTTINMLCTLLKPTSGQARVAGYDVFKEANKVRENIGIIFQEPALDNRLTGWENLEFHAMMYGLKKEERRKRIKEVVKLVGLENRINALVENYSGGMKRRLEIARGLIHNPKVLFLDEPTLGLDAQTRRAIWEYIKKLNEEKGITILLTTHYMEEADFLCKRVGIIDYGKIIALDEPKKLKDSLGGDVVYLEMSNGKKFIKELKKVEWIKSFKLHEKGIALTLEKGEEKIPRLIELARRNKINVKSVELRKPSLEDVFIYYTGRSIRETAPDFLEKMRIRARRRGW